MKRENWLRKTETCIGSVVGVDGMCKELHQSLRADQLLEFVQPMKMVEQGYRVVYESEALNNSDSEFSMRVRVSLRAMWALKDMKHLMSSLQDPVFAWQLISHKLLRYAGFMPLATLALATLLLAPTRGGIYTLAFPGLITFLALAWAGQKREAGGQSLSIIYSIPYYFMLLNIASYKACVAFLKGEKKVIWNPRKG